ncbi:MAG: beta-propeller domain-containing protein [Thermoplasmata archaeon]
MSEDSENVGSWFTGKRLALILSVVVIASVLAPVGLIVLMNPAEPSGPSYPDIPGYEGLVITLPAADVGADACQAGEFVTELPIDEIKRYAPLEEAQEYVNMHPELQMQGPYYEDGLMRTMDDVALLGAEESNMVPPRDVEEADIVKLVGDTYFILNPYRGLIIVDVSNPDEPDVLGRARVYGEPVEMYIVGDNAYLVVQARYQYWYDLYLLENVRQVCDFHIGSQIVVVDISNLTAPEIVDKLSIPGYVQDTRRVGNVIYAASNDYMWKWFSPEGEDTTHVTSFDISDPTNVSEVMTIDFNGSYNQVHVTESAIFIAQPDWGDELRGGPTTAIVYVDISDPSGQMSVEGDYDADGFLDDRYQMDYYDGMFRFITHYWGWGELGESELWILDVSDPANLSLLGNLLIDDAGTLMATRFAGERAYTIHLPERIDPLDVLEIPGWITHMEVRGDRILALGVDDTAEELQVALSLFDVSDPYNAVLMDRVTIGEGWSWSSANWDPKQLSVMDDQELVVVPFTSSFVDRNEWWRTAHAIQLVDFDLSSGDLTVRGIVNTPSSITRTRHHADRILASSDRTLQVIDFTDRDDPAVTAIVELAVHIMDYFKMGDHFVRLVQHDYGSTMRLETRGPSGIVSMDTGMLWGHALPDEPYVYMVGHGSEDRKSYLRIFDYSDPLNPGRLGEVELPSEGYGIGIAPMMDVGYYGYSSLVPALEDGYVVFYSPEYDWEYETPRYTLHVISVLNPYDPTVLSRYSFRASMVMNALIEDDTFYFTDYEYSWERVGEDYIWETRDWLGRISLADLNGPAQLPSVDIPGMMINVDGDRVYTLAGGWAEFQTVNVLELQDDDATVLLAVQVDGHISGIFVEDGVVYLSNTTAYWYWIGEERPRTYFVVLDVTDTENPLVLGTFAVGGYASLWKLEGGYAFLNTYSGCHYMFDVRGDPSFRGVYHSSGWVTQLRVYDDKAYFVEGLYGVEVVDLT